MLTRDECCLLWFPAKKLCPPHRTFCVQINMLMNTGQGLAIEKSLSKFDVKVLAAETRKQVLRCFFFSRAILFLSSAPLAPILHYD